MDFYNNPQPTTVSVTPVNYAEMIELSKGDGSGMELQVCRDTCLCARTEGCWSNFAEGEYTDSVPRHSPNHVHVHALQKVNTQEDKNT